MNFTEYKYQIGAHFLSALIDGDTSGLEYAEETELDAFERMAHEEHGKGGHWAVTGDSDLGTCDVTGLVSDVRPVSYMVPS